MTPIATLADGREVFSYPANPDGETCGRGDMRCMFYKPATVEAHACKKPNHITSCMFPGNNIYVTEEQYLLLNLVHGGT